GSASDPAKASAALRGLASASAIAAALRRLRCGRGLIVVAEPFGICAAVALESRFDPIDCSAVAIRALSAVAEFRQAFDGGLVFVQIQLRDEFLDRVVRCGSRSRLCALLREKSSC